MRVLLDENIPAPALASLQVLVPHTFNHVGPAGWAGKTDKALFALAAGAGYDVIVSLDRRQLYSAEEWKALKRVGLHHVSIRQSRATEGARGSLRLMASLLLATPRVVDDLEHQSGGCVVEVRLLEDRNRHQLQHARRRYQSQRTIVPAPTIGRRTR